MMKRRPTIEPRLDAMKEGEDGGRCARADESLRLEGLDEASPSRSASGVEQPPIRLPPGNMARRRV